MKAIRVVNITCLMAALSLIVFFQHLYSIDSEQVSKGIFYMGKILRNETLTAVQLNHISDMLEWNPSKTYNNIEGVECFLKVYYDLHLQNYDHDLNLNFQLFENSQMEYRRVQKCSDFLNMAIERFQYSPEKSQKTNRILKVLHNIQYNYATDNYIQLSSVINRFCLIALTQNEEKNIIPKMDSLLMQNDTNFKIVMIDNYSLDNTIMFGQYYLEKYRKTHNTAPTVISKLAANKFFTKTSVFVKEINQECQSEEIIIFIRNYQSFIGSDALRTVSRAMTDIRIKLASFNSFNANSKSIGGAKIYTQNSAVILDTETVYAFKTQLLNSVTPAWQDISHIAEVASFEETFNNMLYFLYLKAMKDSAYKHFDQVILRNTLTEPGRTVRIENIFSKPVSADEK